jgi:hypothetical protein
VFREAAEAIRSWLAASLTVRTFCEAVVPTTYTTGPVGTASSEAAGRTGCVSTLAGGTSPEEAGARTIVSGLPTARATTE